MNYIVTSKLKSNSHNAPYDPELGRAWPVGERFRFVKRHPYGLWCNRMHLEQLGGEEVLLCIEKQLVLKHFRKE